MSRAAVRRPRRRRTTSRFHSGVCAARAAAWGHATGCHTWLRPRAFARSPGTGTPSTPQRSRAGTSFPPKHREALRRRGWQRGFSHTADFCCHSRLHGGNVPEPVEKSASSAGRHSWRQCDHLGFFKRNIKQGVASFECFLFLGKTTTAKLSSFSEALLFMRNQTAPRLA